MHTLTLHSIVIAKEFYGQQERKSAHENRLFAIFFSLILQRRTCLCFCLCLSRRILDGKKASIFPLRFILIWIFLFHFHFLSFFSLIYSHKCLHTKKYKYISIFSFSFWKFISHFFFHTFILFSSPFILVDFHLLNLKSLGAFNLERRGEESSDEKLTNKKHDVKQKKKKMK